MIKEDLSTWFDDSKGGGTWVDISRTDDDGEHPECGENTDKQGKAKCVPKKKAKKLSQKEKDRLVRRKRDKDTDSQSPDNASSDPSDQRKNESAMRSITEDEENEPKDEDLWQDVLAVTKGEKDSVSANGETVEAPNDGDGFDVYPSAYSNGWATKMYNKLGGEWKTVDENVTKKAIKLGLMGEDLDQWFDEEWVDISETDEDGNHPPCGETHDTPERMENPEENYPKCVPKSKAKDMTEKEKEELVRKKQKSVNQDDADQSSEDGDSDEPTYTSSDPNEHFLKQNKTTMNESTLRSIIREEIKEARVGRNQNMADTGYPEIVKRTKALMNRPVVGIDTNRRGDVYVMKFQGSMRSGISIAAFEQKGIQITSVSYEDGIITLRVRNR